MITTLFLITLAVIAIVKVNKDTVKSKGTILIILGCMVLVQFYDHIVYEAKIDGLREKMEEIQRGK